MAPGEKGAYAVITTNDLSRIRNTVNPPKATKAGLEKERLRQLSVDRANKWPNTLEAARERKNKQRLERLDQQEAERCEIDRQEALIKAENRRLQIERANKMLYDETDRVKTFHSALMMSDVMQERENQIRYKAKLKQVVQRQDDEFHRNQMEALALATEAEYRRVKEIREKDLSQRDVQLAQLEEWKERIIAERTADLEEGEFQRKKAQEFAVMSKNRMQERMDDYRRINQETAKANEALKKIKQMEKQKEHEEEQRIIAFARKKEALILERKMREEESRRQKDKRRNDMIQRMEDDLERRRQENLRVELKQKDEADGKEAAEAARRAEIARLEQEAIDRSRAQQAAIKKAIRDKERADDYAMTLQMKAREARNKELEEEERMGRYVTNKAVQAVHLKQMRKKQEKLAYERARELAEQEAQRLIGAEEDELFRQYTAVCMDEWAKDGKSLLPMQIEIARQQFAASKLSGV